MIVSAKFMGQRVVKINDDVSFCSNYDPLGFLIIFSTLSFIFMVSITNPVSKINNIKNDANS